MGKKKKAEVKSTADKTAEAANPQGKPAKTEGTGTAQTSEGAYRAAAVVFFTRNDDASVARVLVAVEERKVKASFLGLEDKGKVAERLVVFPMGRKEKKDKNDPVETAKREYIEETLDFGSLARYLDFADFDGGGDVAATRLAPGSKVPMTWTGADNMALYFAPAGLTVLFCEVPAQEADDSGHEPPAKKQRKEEMAAELQSRPKPSPSYHVGKVGHLQSVWLDVKSLQTVAQSKEKAPKLSLQGQDCRFFPTSASVLRLPEARRWLGMTHET
ncbi:unnamed protein product [Symbiodinium pilosum]|uniref:Uncharacterized protein n=1 Tax=Symbiodinium pilosum TaxID=2952 RepID=A0A812K5G6_SYMPI|nr:unnamed protein product [Symbiodinium pilosum]